MQIVTCLLLFSIPLNNYLIFSFLNAFLESPLTWSSSSLNLSFQLYPFWNLIYPLNPLPGKLYFSVCNVFNSFIFMVTCSSCRCPISFFKLGIIHYADFKFLFCLYNYFCFLQGTGLLFFSLSLSSVRALNCIDYQCFPWRSEKTLLVFSRLV